MSAGKIWLIGSSSGIGLALAEEYANLGYEVALSGRNEIDLKNALGSLRGDGHIILPCDVTDAKSIGKSVETLFHLWPSVDQIIFLAAVYEPSDIIDFELEMAERTININLLGAFRLVNQLKSKWDKVKAIAMVSSPSGYSPLPSAGPYGISKAALNYFTTELRIELSGQQTKVQLICPGFVKTRLTEKNNFTMPWILTPAQAAKKIIKGLSSSRYEIHFPKILTLPYKILAILPYFVYLRLFKLVLRKTINQKD